MKTNSDKTEIGQRGEDAAVRFLYSQGFEILERNWRSGHLEIDIIAKDGEYFCFIYSFFMCVFASGHK